MPDVLCGLFEWAESDGHSQQSLTSPHVTRHQAQLCKKYHESTLKTLQSVWCALIHMEYQLGYTWPQTEIPSKSNLSTELNSLDLIVHQMRLQAIYCYNLNVAGTLNESPIREFSPFYLCVPKNNFSGTFIRHFTVRAHLITTNRNWMLTSEYMYHIL